MAHVVKDRVMETTASTGTGTITLDGAVAGYQDFSVIGNANTTYYAILGGSEWEVGIGTYTSSGTALSRDTVLESSNAGSLVNFSAGTKNVICTYPAEKSVYQDGSYSNPAWITSLDDSKVLPSMSGNSGKFLTNNGTDSSWETVFPSGTVMLFVQTTAPTGWTKSTAHDDKALRVVSGTVGSGGTVAFTTAFASQSVSGSISSTTATNIATTAGGSVNNTTLAESQIPSHSHSATQWRSNGSAQQYGRWGTASDLTNPTSISVNATGGGGAHSHGFTGSSHNHTQDAHTHTFTGTAIDLAVQYVDVIIATKD